MTQKALVSVIMPAYNAADFIPAAIRSVQNQTWQNWELLIIDDDSNDFTLPRIKEFSREDSRIRVLQNRENRGPGFSRNKGIRAANGEFIAFLDADDLWKPQKLEIQLEFMAKQNVQVCYSSYELITENGQDRKEMIEALPFITYPKLIKSNYIGNLTGIYNAKKLGKIYGPEIRKRQDWALWIAAVKKAGVAKGIQEVLAVYRIRKYSVSGNKIQMLKYNFNIYYKVLKFGFLRSCKWMLIFLNEHFFVKRRQVRPLD